ncbi:MAG: methyltransferase domain-containing protein [Rhodospirillales bacterium]
MTADSAFWDRIAPRYARSRISDQASYDRKLAVTREHLTPEMDVLEFGCGTGSTAILHAPFVRQITAIDISGGMLDIARAKAAEAGIENLSFRQDGVETFDADGQTWDLVMGHSILHLLADRQAAITKVHALLKPGGRFITSTPCLSGPMSWLKPVLPVARIFGLVPYVAFFTPATLEQEISAAGFRIEHSWQPGRTKALFLIAVRD